MINENRFDYDHSKVDRSPLGVLTLIHPTRNEPIVSINPGLFPRLFCGDNALNPPDLYGYRSIDYLTVDLRLEDLLDRFHLPFETSVLIFRQKKTRYPSVPLIAPGEYSSREEEIKLEKLARANQLEGKFQPDLSRGWYSTVLDRAVNVFLALELATGKAEDESSGNPILEYEELNQNASKHGLSVQRNALELGFQTLISPKVTKLIVEREVLAEDQLGILFEGVMDWNTMMAINRQKKSIGSSYYWPYPLEAALGRNILPDIRFLPYIGRGMLDYLSVIHELVDNGQEYGYGPMQAAVVKIFAFSGEVLTEHLRKELGAGEDVERRDLFTRAATKRPELAESVESILAEVRKLQGPMQKVLDYYKRRPYLLNKTNPDLVNSAGETPSLEQIREEIRFAGGGRGSRKPLYFEVKQGTPQGNV